MGHGLVLRVLVLALVGLSVFPSVAHAVVTIDWTPVGNPGNAPDPLNSSKIPSVGSVSYPYQISKNDVTNAQYAEFLNAVAASDPKGLYNPQMGSDQNGGITRSGSSGSYTYAVKTNMADKPVIFVSIGDAMRFANWMNNGQGSSTTESGAYNMSQSLSTLVHVSNATVWIPTENEWYKAAYYDPTLNSGAGGYWLYATRSNSAPTVATANAAGFITNPGANVANYANGAGGLTAVGSAGPDSASYYGTFDQVGNVYQWNEAIISDYYRGVRGGTFGTTLSTLQSLFRSDNTPPDLEFATVGFRLASLAVPEPSRAMLLLAGMASSLTRRRRSSYGC